MVLLGAVVAQIAGLITGTWLLAAAGYLGASVVLVWAVRAARRA